MPQETLKTRKVFPLQKGYEAAVTTFSNVLLDKTTPLTIGRVHRGLAAVEQAVRAIPGYPKNLMQMELVDLASQAAAEARQRNLPAMATNIELTRTAIVDRLSIERGIYPLVEVRTRLPEQKGDPVTYIPVYQASEVKQVFGQPSTEPIELGS